MPKTTYQSLAEEAKGVYVGEFDRRGYKCGLGCYFWDDSSVYEGDWMLGEKHGLGVYVWPDGTTYAGEWKDGHKHGYGVAANPDGRKLEGDWANGKFVSKNPSKAQAAAQASYVEQAKARGLARRKGFTGPLEGTAVAEEITRKLNGGNGGSPLGDAPRMTRRSSRSAAAPYDACSSPRLSRRRSSLTGMNLSPTSPGSGNGPTSLGKILLPGMDPNSKSQHRNSHTSDDTPVSPPHQMIDSIFEKKPPSVSQGVGLRNRKKEANEEDLIRISDIHLS